MAKKMISALKEVVGEGVELQERRGKIKSALMNKNRLAIFQFLCRVPGSSTITLSKHFNLSLSTIKWHLVKLREGKYVVEADIGNRLAYFPKGMVEDQYMEVLSTLDEDLPMAVFWTLLKNQGLTQKELAKSLNTGLQPLRLALKKLKHLNLIISVIDGRYRRYYPTDELYALGSKNRRKLRQFKTNLIKKLESEVLNPKIHISKGGERMIEIATSSTKNYIYIPSDLSASVLSYYAEKLEGVNRGERRE